MSKFRQRLFYLLMAGILASWLGVMGIWVRSLVWRWEHTYAMKSETTGFVDMEKPKGQVQQRLDAASESLVDEGYEVWIDRNWDQNNSGVEHVIKFSRGFYPRISGEIRIEITRARGDVVRYLQVKVGGDDEHKTQIDQLGNLLEEILLYG